MKKNVYKNVMSMSLGQMNVLSLITKSIDKTAIIAKLWCKSVFHRYNKIFFFTRIRSETSKWKLIFYVDADEIVDDVLAKKYFSILYRHLNFSVILMLCCEAKKLLLCMHLWPETEIISPVCL